MAGLTLLKGPWGFVGSAFVRHFLRTGKDFDVVTSLDWPTYQPPEEVALFLDCAGNGRKYLAERDPEYDRKKNVLEVAENLRRFRPRRYVLLSSSAVYADPEDPAACREVPDPPGEVGVYGRHKREAERLVRRSGVPYLILRPAGFFGPGLARGALYDALEGQRPWVAADSVFQLLDVEAFARGVLHLLPEGGEVNAVPREAVCLQDLFPGDTAHWPRDLPRVRFSLESPRFWRVLDDGGGREAVLQFAGEYRRVEARAAVPVLVLAGGEGRRLGGAVPKPLVPIRGRPLAARAVQPFLAAGYRRLVFLLRHRGAEIEAALRRAEGLRDFEVLKDPAPLGTGGAVLAALGRVAAATILVVNADTLLRGVDPEALVKHHRRLQGVATLLLVPRREKEAGTAVTVDRLGRVIRVGCGPWLHAGVTVLDREGFLSAAGPVRRVPFEAGLLAELVSSGRVYGYPRPDAACLDAGTPEGLAAAERFLEETCWS